MTKPKPRCESPHKRYGDEWNFLGVIHDDAEMVYDLWLSEDGVDYVMSWPQAGVTGGACYLKHIVEISRQRVGDGWGIPRWRVEAIALIDEYLDPDPSVSPNARGSTVFHASRAEGSR